MARLDGNVYVDPAYTSQEAIDALGGTSSITGEVLTYGVNAYASGGTTGNVPAVGGTIFYNGWDNLGASIYNDGSYDMVLVNTRSNYLYAVPKVANKSYTRDIIVQVEGGTHQHLALLGRSDGVTLAGDITFTAKNVHFGDSNDNMGGGDSNDSNCVILGDITFSIADSTSGGSFYVHCGDVGTVDDPVKVTGTVTNFLSTSAFRGIRTGDGRAVYADFDLVVTGSSFSNSLELGYATNNSTWEGEFTMTVSSSTAANIYAFERADYVNGDNTFTLNVAAGEAATRTATIGRFEIINIASGATLVATTINDADELNIELGAKITTADIQSVGTINVIGELVENDTVLISGLTISELGADLYVGDVRYETGKFPGFYEIVGGDLIIHNATSTVLLVNSNYTDGEKTDLGPKGYSTVAKAQAAVTDKATTTVMVYAMDHDVEENVFTADVVTKDYTTSFVGEDGETVSLDGFDIIVGDEAADVESANVSISYTDNINAVRFGNVTGTAKVLIDHAGDDEDTQLGTLDLTGANVADAQISVDNSVIGEVKLADQEGFVGSVTIKNSTIESVFGGKSGVAMNDLTGGNTITNVYAEGNGDSIKLGTSEVETYIAGLSEQGAALETLVYNDSVSAKNLIIGGNANTIGSIDATFMGGNVKNVAIGGEGDTITGDVNATFTAGTFEEVGIAEDATVDGDINVTFAGGTVAQRSNGTFYGLIYGASVTGTLDGGDEGASRTLNVEGNAKVGSVKGFTALNVTGGTLNVSSGTDKSEITEYNKLEIDGDILNRRGIQAGTITANNLVNYGIVGTLRGVDDGNILGIDLSGSLTNYDYVMTSSMEIDGDFYNSGRITSVGDISVDGAFSNSGELFFKAISSPDGTFTQEGGLALNNINVVNTGFISAGSLTGVKNLTTSKMYVTGGAEIDGNLTIEADAEVAFTNKANPDIENGLELSGSIYMSDTSRLVVSGTLTTSGTKTITVNVGDLEGVNEIVRAEGGVNDWTIKLTGTDSGLYSYVKDEYSVTIYSLDELVVNSSFSADKKIVIEGNTFVYGVNAFSSVADAVAAAKSGASIVIYNDATGMDVAAGNYDVELINSTVGAVSAKNILVSSDSTVGTIVTASQLTVEADALLTLNGTIPSTTSIVIDASEGAGSRLVLDVDPALVALDASNVTVIGPQGKTYTAMVLSADPEAQAPAHVGDLYLISSDYVYFRKDQSAFVDGDTFDPGTGDALFNGVNVFATRAEAIAAAKAAGGTLVLSGFSTGDGQKGSSEVPTIIEFSGGGSGIYGTDGSYFESADNHTTVLLGTNVTTSIYGINKAFVMDGDFTFIAQKSNGGALYITGNTYTSKMNGDIDATIADSTFSSVYIGYGDFGTDPTAPIDINLTVTNSNLGRFYGINMSGSTATRINANINVSVMDSTVGEHFYVIHTADWVANNGANIYQSTFESGSVTVTMGGTTVTNTLRPGDSLTHGANALQVFNAPTTLHIVASDKSAVTRADWVMEWDTIIIDADARLELGHNLQFQTAYRGEGTDVMDGAGTTIQILVNMSGYEGGTHTVIVSGLANDGVQNQIYVNEDLSNIAVIGDNDLTGQCQLVYSGFRQQDAHWALRRIAVFDKTDDMYVNATYTDDISGTTIGGQELFFGANAHTDFTQAIEYATEWGGTIVVTGGIYDAESFNGNNVELQKGTIAEIEMGNRKASILKVAAGATFETADGSNMSILDVDGNAVLGDVEDFVAITVDKGADVTFGAVSGSNLALFADSLITAADLDLSDATITIDVDGYIGGSHTVISTDKISGFNAANVTFVGANADKYSLVENGTDLVLKTTIASDTYVNSEYTVATTGTILEDGTYLEFGFNAFNSLADAVAGLGSAANTVTVTGGTFADDIKLAGANFVMLDGALAGTVYVCPDDDSFSGTVIAIEAGSIGGIDLTAAGGAYSVSKAAITFGDDITVNGGIIGGGDTSLTIGNGTTTVGGIEGVNRITLQTSSLLNADYIELNNGVIYVTGSAVAAKVGNLTKIISTQAGISGATFAGDPGFSVYKSGNDVYVLDLTRIYVDPNYTSAVTGTTAATGDTLSWGVNAFSDINAAYNALIHGGTLFVANWGTPGSQAGDIRPTSPASIVAQGPTNFSVCFNNGNPATFDTDVYITITNTSTPQANTALLNGADGNKNVFNGNVYITFNGTDRVNTNTSFKVSKYSVFNGDLVQINIDGSNGLSISDDYWLFGNTAESDFRNLGLLELNITGVTTRNQAKWTGLFDGDPTLPAGMHVVANIKDCLYVSSYPNWSIGLVSTGANARNVVYDVHLSGTTIDGNISGQRTSLWNGVPGDTSVYEGTKTLYIDGGDNLVNQAVMFHHIIVDANASLRVRNVNNDGGQRGVQFMAANSSGPNSIEVDVSNYNGEDKMIISTPTFTGAAFDLVLKGDTEEKFVIGVGRSHGVYIITKGGDVMYNADISSDDNGIAFANTFVHVDEDEEANSNAFNDYDAAKAAIDARPGKNLFVSGIGGEDEFYADGYAVTVTDGVYETFYGSDDEEDTVASVNIKVTGGSFGDIIVAESGSTVTGDALVELAGGTYGIPAVYETPEATEDDPNPEPELVEDEVPATIDGSRDAVNGTSTLVVSKDLSIAGQIIGFDEAFVNVNLSVTGDFESDVITIDASKKLTVGGDVLATTIVIDAENYEGPTKAIAVAGNFENEQPAVSIIGDLETYDYRYVEDTLYLVSKNAGNVYLNADWDESISGTIYNGELLVFGVNAFNSMNDAILKTTSDYTMYVLGGVFNEVYDLTGIGQVNLNITGGTFGGFIVGDGADANHRSTIRINEGTVSNAVSIGSLTGVEGSTIGYRVIAAKDTAFGTIDGIRYFRFGAGQNVTVNGISYIEIAGATEGLMSGGDLVINLAGYTAGAGVLLQTVDGIANYLVPTEFLADGTPVCRVVIGVENNGDMLMPYYDEATKSIIAVERGEFAFLDANAHTGENGTVVSIDGKSATQVYGYNLSNWNVNAGRYAITGGTLFADGGEETAFYWFFTAAPINVNVKNLRTGGFVAGYNDDSAADQKYREGDFTAVIDATTITWFAAIAGQGNDGAHQEMVVAKYNEEEEEYEDVAWNITISNGTHDTNDFRIARYANLSGGTINVTISDYLLRGDLMLFDRVFNGHAEGHQEELKEVNVTLTNVQEPAAKWIQVWEPQESNSTKINLTITNMNLAGDNTSTIGLFGVDTTGSWNGEADVYISGVTNANGNLNGGRGQTGGGLDNISGTRRLHVVGGTNRIATVREFNSIEISDGAMLTGTRIDMSEGEGFILRGEAGYTGDVKEYALVGTTITGAAQDAAQFLDEDDYEIDGYKAVVGATSVFIYKTTGDVYFSNEYTDAITGTAITDADGTKNFLVYGDNAVISMKNAYASVDNRDGKATIQVVNALSQNLYTFGYKTVVNGGQITNVVGGTNYTEEAPAETVDSVDITINKGAVVTNVSVANEFSQVSGNALITVADGVAFTGTLDGGSDYVGGDSTLVFQGGASAKAITGFDNVVLNANNEVILSGEFTGTVITIDASNFADFTKKVLVANGGFGDVTDITVNVIGDGFGYEFLDDGVTLVVTSDLVGNVFANSDWTEADVHNKFVGDMALVWDKNAFNSYVKAAAAIGQDSTLYVEGGASSEDVTLTKSNDVIVSANTAASSIGSIAADGGAITIANDFTANALTGFSAVNFNAGLDITVGNLEIAEGGTLTIDVTGYAQSETDAVVLSTDTTNLTSDAITVTGEGSGVFYAYVDATDNDVHLMRIDNFYVDVDYGTAGEGIEPGQVNPITGEKLIFGVNAFYYLNDALGKMAPGQNLYINNRQGNNVNTADRIANLYITDSTVPVVINGYTSGGDTNGSKRYYGDINVTIVNSTFATAAGSFLLGDVNNNEGWNHQNYIFGNGTVTVTGSTMGGNTGAILVTGFSYTHFYGTEDDPALVTFNFTDSIIRDDILFIGDSPVGKTAVIDGQTYTGANLVINLENVVVPQDKWWRIQGGNQESEGVVSVNIKNSTIGGGDGSMRFALDDNWGTGWGAVPTSHSDFVFTVENSNIVGYLVAGRLDYGRDDAELTTYDGAKVLNLIGDNNIRYAYWFREVNLTAGATLTGRTLRMATDSATINVDVTGYTGKSKILISMTNAFENVKDGTIVVNQDPESEYEVMISDRAVVIKGALKDIYVNSDYTAETCVLGTVYNDELLFFGENAFGDLALATAALTEDAVLYVTGGALTIANDAYAFSNTISVDASAQLTYKGSEAITIDGVLVNNGSFMISAKGFVDGTQTDVTVLSATLISGTGTFRTDDASYAINVVGNEVHLTLKKSEVFVDTAWAGLEDGTIVSAGGVDAVIGEDAFATADAAAAAVLSSGVITVLGGDVAFSSAIVCTVVAAAGSSVQAAVGTGSANGVLTVQSGAVANNISVRAKGTLTVDAGAKVTGGLGMINGAAVSFAAGSVLDFDISAMEAGASATVTNLSILTGAPDYTITLAAAQAEGTYNLATDAASFNSNVTLMVGDSALGVVSLNSTFATGGYVYTLGLTDNNVLALTIEEGELPDVPSLAYVNSEWAGLEDGTVVTIGSINATIGYDAFADLGSGIAGVTDDGSILVAGGEVSFANGYYKTITVASDATVIGTASFLNRPITINGTMAFDVALTSRTTAQFADVQFISGDTKYTLTVENPAVGVYMLASGLWYDDLYQPVFNGSVVFGDEVLTIGNDVQVGDYIYGLRTTSNLELMLTIDKAVAPASDVEYLTASLDGFQNMIGRIVGSETAGFTSDIKFYTLDSAPWGMNLGIEDGWTYAGVGDFNGDGMDDILRYNSSNGLVVSDNSNGNGTFTPAVLNFKNASWDILGTGDFNGDGFDDVLVANRTAASATIGLLGYWSKGTEWTLINGYSDEWTLVDTGDYDGNGCCDMLWKNSFVGEGGLTYNAYCTWRLGDIEGLDWSIVMVAKVNETETPDTDAWSFLCTGDFNGDGIDDIAMVNDVGMVAINSMASNGTSLSWTTLDMIAEGWSVVGVADLNLDGIDDIILGNEVEGVGTLAGYWQISPDEQTGYPTDTWKDVGWLV